MAPIHHRRDNPAELKTWLIAVAVVAAVVVTALIAYLVIFRFRNRQYQEAAKRDPYLTRKEWARRRKLSNLERLEEEEVQRQLILRKTLTSRTSSRHGSDRGSAEEPRIDRAEKSREQQWKKWEAGYAAEADNDSCEGHPLIQEHPAVKVEGDQTPRSVSPTRVPLLPVQEPEPRRTSLWERRLSDLHHPSRRKPSNSPPRAPPSSSPAPDPLIEGPHIFAHPTQTQQHLLRNTSPRPARSVGDFQSQQSSSQSPSQQQRSRAASADSRYAPKLRFTATSSHNRTSSHPTRLAPSQIPPTTRVRSNSATSAPFTSLVSLPPPAALPHSASPRSDGFLSQGLEEPRIQTPGDLSLPRAPEQTVHTRTRSHEMLPFFRPSASSSQNSRRKPLPHRSLDGKVSASSLVGGGRTVVSPTVSPVEEATLETERAPISPEATLLADSSCAAVPEKAELARMAACDRDILPSQLRQTLQLGPTPTPTPARPTHPQQENNSSSEEDSQPSSFEGGTFFEGPNIPPRISQGQPEEQSRSPSSHPPPGLVVAPERQQRTYLDAQENNDEVGTAFSFEVGDQLKELGISVRRPEPPPASPSSTGSELEQLSIESDSEDEQIGTTFSFEEGDRLRELAFSARGAATKPQNPLPSESPELVASQRSPHHLDSEEEEEEEEEENEAFSFEEESHLKEIGLSHRHPPAPKRRNSPLAQLEIPRLTKDRSRSFEDRSNAQPSQALRPEDFVHRLRSQSIEPVVQGKWELQVSVLDQTGARHPRNSREDGGSDLYSSSSEPASPEYENTFDAAVAPAPPANPPKPAVVPVGPRWPPKPMQAQPSSSTAHSRTPSTPLTSPNSDISSLCRANFASPIKERQLAEEQFSPRSPPADRPHFYSPSPVSPPLRSAPTFAPPHGGAGWSVATTGGWEHRGTTETGYENDTMKETWGSGPVTTAPDTEQSKVSFRLSGPPDFMPAFF